MAKKTDRLMRAIGVVLFCAVQVVAQDVARPEVADAASQDPDRATVEAALNSLEALQRSIRSKRTMLADVEAKRNQSSDEQQQIALDEDITAMREAIVALEEKFAAFAIGEDTRLFDGEIEEEFDLQTELEKLLLPIVSELKNATAMSREIEDLRSELKILEEKSELSSKIVGNIERKRNAKPSPEIDDVLAELEHLWQGRYKDTSNQTEAVRLQLESKLATKKSVLESTSGFLKDFSRTRGLNLLLAAAAFCGVYFGLRGAYALVLKIRPMKRSRSFAGRLAHIVMHIGSTLAALLAVIFVFNATGDWFLLGLVVLFLLGVGWASINTIPQHVERIKLMLNIGAVREEQRLVLEGVPWRVDTLGFVAQLSNPLLEGGRLLLPVRDLIGLHSRAPGEKEEWFPSRPGDWVTLDDGRFGRVVYQTPAIVHIVELGGAQVEYGAGTYLGLNPRNLTPGFRIEQVFGIDYKHQAECTTTVPGVMQEALLKGLLDSMLERDELKHLSVVFSEAGASSLDYRVILDVAGSAASRMPRIEEKIAELLVDVCNEHGWEIPFQQITLHQATTG